MEKRFWNLLWVLTGLVAIMAAVSILLSIFMGGSFSRGAYGQFGMMGYGFYGLGIIMPIIGVISVAFVLVFIFFIFDAARGNGDRYRDGTDNSPERIARERLARGEISEEEYLRIIENLRR